MIIVGVISHIWLSGLIAESVGTVDLMQRIALRSFRYVIIILEQFYFSHVSTISSVARVELGIKIGIRLATTAHLSFG